MLKLEEENIKDWRIWREGIFEFKNLQFEDVLRERLNFNLYIYKLIEF